MDYIEINLNIRLKQDIKYYNLPESLSRVINNFFKYNDKLMKFHKINKVKLYSYSLLEPIEKDKLYKKGKLYSFKIRFLSREILNDFYKSLIEMENTILSVVSRNFEVKTETKKISYIESLTPAIISVPYSKPLCYIDRRACNKGVLEKYLTSNAFRKYNVFKKVNRLTCDFIEDIEVINNKSIIFSYKGGVMIGNKFRIKIKEDDLSQELARMLISTGIGEKNTLSYGFCNPIYKEEA